MLEHIDDILEGLASAPGGESRKRHSRVHWTWWIVATVVATGVMIYFF